MQRKIKGRWIFQNGAEFKSFTGDTKWGSQSGGGFASRGLRTPREHAVSMGTEQEQFGRRHEFLSKAYWDKYGCSVPVWMLTG